MIKRKNRKKIVVFLILGMFVFTSLRSIPIALSDDNYSTYLYNQSINVYNDKALLFQENSDGSNSYRNIFQSNFLFPSKLNIDMLSTTSTIEYSRYQFNQFYFDNLNNNYAYGSSNSSNYNYQENEFTNVNINSGNLIQNNSINEINSQFGYYNSTYNFDNYQETYSNYGNYNGTYSFENEVGLTNTSISFIDQLDYGLNAEVINNLDNHLSVLKISTIENWKGIKNTYSESISNDLLEFWFKVQYSQLTFLSAPSGIYIDMNTVRLRIYYGDGLGSYNYYTYYNDFTQWNHLKIEFSCNYDYYSVWLNDTLLTDDLPFIYDYDRPSFTDSRFILSTEGIAYIDAVGYNWDSNYDINDNLNSYGKQSELENNNFYIEYKPYTSISIVNDGLFRNNIINITDNSALNRINFINNFNSITNDFSTEFYFKHSDVSRRAYIRVRGSLSDEAVLLYIYDNKLYIYDGSISTYIEISSLSSNIWYNFKIDINFSNQLFNISLNQNLIANNIQFKESVSYISLIQFYTYSSHESYSIFIDNIDFSWNSGYYPYRILDLIPINETSDIFNSEIVNNHEIILQPNQEIQSELGQGTTSGYDNYQYVDDIYVPSDAVYLYSGGTSTQTDIFGFDDISFTNITFSNITIYLKARLNSVGTEKAEISLGFDGSFYPNRDLYIDYAANEYLSQWYTISYIGNFNDINNIQVLLKKPQTIGVGFYFYYLYIVCHYSDYELCLDYELEISHNFDNPITYNLYYRYCMNKIQDVNISVYNYDLSEFYLINNIYSNLSFTTNMFSLNESGYFRNDLVKVRIHGYNYTRFLLYIDYLCLNITYGFQEYLGNQKLIHYFHRYDNSYSYIGNISFELEIYQNYTRYRFKENNLNTNDYIYNWININTENIDLENIELQCHGRYGLNTLDIEILNFYYIIYFNYNESSKIEFREQSRKDLTGYYLRTSFNFSTNTINHLDLTGIYGNYSYNTFKGCRSLYGSTSEIFHRYFAIPYFNQDLSVAVLSIDNQIDVGSGLEPDYPSLPYWSYDTYRVVDYTNIYINVGNWSVQYKTVKVEKYTAKYPYNPKSYDDDDLGSWKWKIKFTDSFSYTVSFNFMRNAICDMLNIVLLFTQYVGYLGLSISSLIFMYIFTAIIVFLYNTVLYYLYYGLITVLWYIFEGLILALGYIWLGLVWVYENLLIPFLEWCNDVLFPWLIDFLILILAHAITLLIYFITLGNIDYDSTYELVHELLTIFVAELLEYIDVFVNNFDSVVYFLWIYLLCMVLLYFTYLYCKSRGMINKSIRIYKTLMFYLTPAFFVYNIIIKFIKMVR